MPRCTTAAACGIELVLQCEGLVWPLRNLVFGRGHTLPTFPVEGQKSVFYDMKVRVVSRFFALFITTFSCIFRRLGLYAFCFFRIFVRFAACRLASDFCSGVKFGCLPALLVNLRASFKFSSEVKRDCPVISFSIFKRRLCERNFIGDGIALSDPHHGIIRGRASGNQPSGFLQFGGGEIKGEACGGFFYLLQPSTFVLPI